MSFFTVKGAVLIAVLSCLCLGVDAKEGETGVLVKGVVLDSISRKGENGAVIQFFRLTDMEKPVAYTMTDSLGRFSKTISGEGKYCMTFSNLGRKSVSRTFSLSDAKEVDLGEILVSDDIEALKASTVVTQRPLVKMESDKVSYNVAEDVDSKTTTVLDMLRKIPMVSVDGQDNITVNGSSSFLVYVDGKPNQMLSKNASQVFKMMPASVVKTIEVITNPGVKYDAEGVGGVLNITTNLAVAGGPSAADGFYGTLKLNGSNRGLGGGTYASMQKGKLAASLNLDLSRNKTNGAAVDVTRTQDNGYSTHSFSEENMKTPFAYGDLGLSYEIDSLNLVSASAGWTHYGSINDGTNMTEMTFPGTGSYSYNSTLWFKTIANELHALADYQHLWRSAPGRSLTFSYQFSGNPSVNNNRNSFDANSAGGIDLTDRKTDGSTDSRSHTFQVDFTSPIAGKHSLSLGLKYIDRHNSSDETAWLWNGSTYIENTSASLEYDFYNRIGAAYAELSGNYGAISAKAGARIERTWQSYRTSGVSGNFRTAYSNLVPSANIQWNISQMQNLGLSYNMRISRPGISWLNPYVDVSDPTAKTYGNPALDVEKSNNLGLIYNFMSPALMASLSLSHSFSDNGISSYTFYDGDNLLNTTYDNIVKSRRTRFNAYVMLVPGAKTRIILNGGGGYSHFESSRLGQNNYGWSYNIMAGLQQTLPWDIRLSANVIATGREQNLQGWSGGIAAAMAGLTKTFLDDRLSFSINALNPLSDWRKLHISTHSEGSNFRTETDIRVPINRISFEVSWTFGKKGNYGPKSVKRSIENEEQLGGSSASGNGASSVTQSVGNLK